MVIAVDISQRYFYTPKGVDVMGGRGASSGANTKSKTYEWLKQKYFSQPDNHKYEDADKTIEKSRKTHSDSERPRVTSADAHKNKSNLVDFVKQQTKVELNNDKSDIFNKKRKVLYTQISRKDYNNVASLLLKNGFRLESHVNDNYWIYL